jgi:hypothetical protein
MNTETQLARALARYYRERKILGAASKDAFHEAVVAYLARIEEHLDRILKRSK